MFKRRTPRSILQNIREFFWPSMGWKRFWLYTKVRIFRLDDTARNIGLGLAFGASLSFSPFMGTHIIQAAAASFLFRANILAAAIGTLVGNPWTFPFIWVISLYTGLWICRGLGIEIDSALGTDLSLGNVWHYTTTHNPAEILVPWVIGGYVLMILSTPIYYLIFSRGIKKMKARKLKKRKKKT